MKLFVSNSWPELKKKTKLKNNAAVCKMISCIICASKKIERKVVTDNLRPFSICKFCKV